MKTPKGKNQTGKERRTHRLYGFMKAWKKFKGKALELSIANEE